MTAVKDSPQTRTWSLPVACFCLLLLCVGALAVDGCGARALIGLIPGLAALVFLLLKMERRGDKESASPARNLPALMRAYPVHAEIWLTAQPSWAIGAAARVEGIHYAEPFVFQDASGVAQWVYGEEGAHDQAREDFLAFLRTKQVIA